METAGDRWFYDGDPLDGDSGSNHELQPDPPELTGAERCLADYSLAVEALERFESDHHEVILALAELRVNRDAREAALKAACRHEGATANAMFAVTVQAKARRWWDIDTLLLRLPRLRELPGVIVETINRPEVERLIKQGAVPKADAEAVLHVEALTPAVTIRRL
jgi:hypothetical protein